MTVRIGSVMIAVPQARAAEDHHAVTAHRSMLNESSAQWIE